MYNIACCCSLLTRPRTSLLERVCVSALYYRLRSLTSRGPLTVLVLDGELDILELHKDISSG